MKLETLTISLEKSTQDSIPFYSPSQPFGFVDEAAHNAQPSLNIFELNSGFNVPYWYASEPITQIQQDENGCFLDSACGSAYGGSYFGCHSMYEPVTCAGRR